MRIISWILAASTALAGSTTAIAQPAGYANNGYGVPYAGGYLGATAYQQRAYGYGLPINPAYPPSGTQAAQSAPTKPADYLVFSGAEASGHNGRYGNIGIIGALGDSHFGNGPVWRAMLDALSYAYDGSAQTINGSAYAGEAALGYIHSWDSGSTLAGYVGGVYRNTSLDPTDPANELEGDTFGLKLQAEGMLYATPDWRTGATAAYIAGPNSPWWTRANIQHRPWGNFFVGPEVVFQGDDTFSAWQLGGLLNGIRIGDTSELGIRAGYKKIENLSGTGYAGAEFSTMF